MSEQFYEWFTQKLILLVFHKWGPMSKILIMRLEEFIQKYDHVQFWKSQFYSIYELFYKCQYFATMYSAYLVKQMEMIWENCSLDKMMRVHWPALSQMSMLGLLLLSEGQKSIAVMR